MHYRHSFHAGNFADVFKHTLLCGLLAALNRKEAPWCYLDTHAGAGRYDLAGAGAAKTGEWRNGIGRVCDAENSPPLVAQYLTQMKKLRLNDLDYPGSPLLAAAYARDQDRLLFCEKVPAVAEELRRSFGRRAAVHVRDGYEAHALLPPPEKRGLVLIDPPFERADEFEAVSELIAAARKRFAGGTYAAWYPLKNLRAADQFSRRVARAADRPTLDVRLQTGAQAPSESVNARTSERVVKQPLGACGLLIVNPPFGFHDEAEAALAFLATRLSQGKGAGYTIATPA